jgi:hypothetical protein
MRQRLSLAAIVLCTLALLAVPPSVLGQTPPGGTPSPAGARGSHWKPARPRLDSDLNRLVDQLATRLPADVAGDAPLASGSLVGVTVRLAAPAEQARPAMAAHGAIIANELGTSVEAYVPVDRLDSLAREPLVLRIEEIVPPRPAVVVSQGTAVHNSPNWNAAGLTGAGVKVGIIDVGFTGYSGLMGVELPATVMARCYTAIGVFTSNVANCETATVHGTAVGEAVHDVAPGATLYIANPASSGDLLQTAQWMASEGVRVINHSVAWTWTGPGDGTSPYTNSPLVAVDQAVAGGITWVNAAGNAARSTWSGAYTEDAGEHNLYFAPGEQLNAIYLSAGARVTVQARWEDGWLAPAPLRDLDVYLHNAPDLDPDSPSVVQCGCDYNNQPGHAPYEQFSYTAPASGTYYLHVNRYNWDSAPAPAWFQLQVFTQQQLSIATAAGSVSNPSESASPGLLAVGAASWSTPATIEPFSSQGPTRDGRIKPDVVGADRGDSVSYGPGGFAGTSQASPHVAGLAALALQRFPSLSPAQVAAYLTSGALPRGPVPNNTWGHGFAYLASMPVADRLGFTGQPTGGLAGAEFAAQPVVAVQASDGSTVTTDNATVVTLSLNGGAGAVLSCAGGLSKTVVSGVASFTGCSFDVAGADYSLHASTTSPCACAPADSDPFTVSNPAPAITSLSPDSAIAGGPAFALTVDGSGFVPGSIVRWNGADQPTAFISPGRLVAAISSLEIATAGSVSVAVFNGAPGGGLSAPAPFGISPGWPFLSAVAVGNEVAVFGRNPAGQLWYRETTGGAFGGWTLAGAGVASRPAAVVAGDDLFVFYRGPAGDLGYVRRSGEAWSGPQTLGGGIVGRPVAAADGAGNLVVVALNEAGQVWYRVSTADAWSEWSLMPGHLSGDLALVNHGGDLYLAGVNAAGESWVRTWDANAASWGPWSGLGGVLAHRPALAASGPDLYYFGLNPAGASWYRVLSGGSWGPWTTLGGILAGAPAAADGPGGLVFAGVNETGDPWERLHAGSWGGWNALGGTLAAGPEMAAAGGQLYLFGVNGAGALWYRTFAGGSWGPWAALGGTLAID